MGNGIRAIEALLQGIRLKCLGKKLASSSIAMRPAALALAEAALASKGLPLGSKQANAHNNRNG